MHGDQFRRHPVFESSPRYQSSAKDIKQLEKDNATPSSAVECDLPVLEGLPAEDQEQIELYIQDHCPNIAAGTKKELEKSSKQKESHSRVAGGKQERKSETSSK